MRYRAAFVVHALLALLALSAGAAADELVAVAPHGAALPPTLATDAPPLLGYLARPAGRGPFPAVVLLRWCAGFGLHDIRAALTIKSWGYVVLALDTLGDAELCQNAGGVGAEARDAHAGLTYLHRQAFVDAGRVALAGWSMGASAALAAVGQDSLARDQTLRFRAAVAWYPDCAGSLGVLTVPTLVMVGARDDWTPAAACQAMAAHQSDIGTTRPAAGGVPVTLVVYPNATHAFDLAEPPHRYLGHLIESDPEATRDALQRMREFLRSALADAAPADGKGLPAH